MRGDGRANKQNAKHKHSRAAAAAGITFEAVFGLSAACAGRAVRQGRSGGGGVGGRGGGRDDI